MLSIFFNDFSIVVVGEGLRIPRAEGNPRVRQEEAGGNHQGPAEVVVVRILLVVDIRPRTAVVVAGLRGNRRHIALVEGLHTDLEEVLRIDQVVARVVHQLDGYHSSHLAYRKTNQ